MGNNQTVLVPSQIQNVESYFNELKNNVKFRTSLGSTTFMKTAIVTFNDALYYADLSDFLINKETPSREVKLISTTSILVGSSSASIAGVPPITSITNTNTNDLLSSTSATTSLPLTNINNNATTTQTTQVTNTLTTNMTNQTSENTELIQYLREQQHLIVAKIFPKYDLSMHIDVYVSRLCVIKQIIYQRYGQCTNCLPFSHLMVTDKAAFLYRQYVKYNLYDRLSTRPFLVDIEKKWIAFQIMCAVNEIHSLQIVHGDIKTENILINSFLWVSLTDFASYKPVYLSTNHPSADYNYYFDISRRRTCCLAPERFNCPSPSAIYTTPASIAAESSKTQTNPAVAPLLLINETDEQTQSNPSDFLCIMDIFSLGCTIAELFMERPLFDFARLISYKEGKYDPKQDLMNEIHDINIVNMIIDMININPLNRHTINEYLQEQNEKSFPSYFVFLKSYLSKYVNTSLTPDDIVIKLKYDLPLILKNLKLNLDHDEENDYNQTSDYVNVLDETQTADQQQHHHVKHKTNDAFLILLSLLLSTARKLKYTRTKLIAIELMLYFSRFLSDTIILDRIIPYFLNFLSNDYEPLLKQQQVASTTSQSKQQQQQILLQQQLQQQQLPIIKSKVIFALNDCLSHIQNIDLQNINIFPELIFDILEKLSKEESYLVRAAVAKTISSFALTSIRYLDNGYLLTKRMLQQHQQQQQPTNAIAIAAVSTTTATQAIQIASSSSLAVNTTTSGTTPGSTSASSSANISSSSPLNNAIQLNQQNSPNSSAADVDNQVNPPMQQFQQQQVYVQSDKLDELTYDKEYQNYQNRIMDIVMHLLTDTAASATTTTTFGTSISASFSTITSTSTSSSNAVKEVLLRSDISRLCSFLGRQKTSEFLLPHMITILNEKTDWSIRAAFFDALCPVLANIGWESLEIVKPLLEQGLKDSEEFVIHRTLITLANMIEIGLFDRQQIYMLLSEHVAPLLCHPSLWIRQGAVNFVSTICNQAKKYSSSPLSLTSSLNDESTSGAVKQLIESSSFKVHSNSAMTSLSTADILCSIIPIINKYLKRNDLIDFEHAEILLSCLKIPLKRNIYDCVAQDGRSDYLFQFLTQRSEIRSLAHHNYPPGYFDCPDVTIQRLFEKLCKMGLTEEDEEKLLAMKEFMDKTRVSRLSSSLHGAEMNTSGTGAVVSINTTQLISNTNYLKYNFKENYILKDGCISIIKDKYLNSIDLNSRVTPVIINNNRRMLSTVATNNSNDLTSTIVTNETQAKTLSYENSLSTSPIASSVSTTTVMTNTLTNTSTSSSSGIDSINQSLSSTSTSLATTNRKSVTLNDARQVFNLNENIDESGGGGSGDKQTRASIKRKFFQQQMQAATLEYENNCVNQFENYINRSKLLFDDLKHKQLRLKQIRDTINSTSTSSLICLSSPALNSSAAAMSSGSASAGGGNSVSSAGNAMISVAMGATNKWKPKGYLIVHSNEHTKNITKLCRNYDSSFFASCSTLESSIKLWSTDNLLDGKSGFFKSRFTYDRFNDGSTNGETSKPYCMTFFDNTSLAVLTEDFKFYKIDFNSVKRAYQVQIEQNLFKNNYCDCYFKMKNKKYQSINGFTNSTSLLNTTNPSSIVYLNDKSLFYYLNKPIKMLQSCQCVNKYKHSKIYPTEMIYIDDTCPTWPVSTKSSNDYYISSTVRGLFCYASNNGYLSLIDMRTRTKAIDVKRDLKKGYIKSMMTDPWYTYLVAGTSNGCIDVYDFRFMLPIQSFQHRSRASVVRLCSHPIYKNYIVASYQGNNEIAIWNIDNNLNVSNATNSNLLKSQFSKNNPEFTFWGVTSVPPLSQKGFAGDYISGMYGITSAGSIELGPQQQQQTQQQQQQCALICASTDMKIRYLDLNDTHRDSFVISSPMNIYTQSQQKSNNSVQLHVNPTIYYEMRQIEGSKVLVELEQINTGQQINLNPANTISSTPANYNAGSPLNLNSNPNNSSALAYQSYCSHHQDAISDLLICYKTSNPTYQPFIVTSSRDGTLKVWR